MIEIYVGSSRNNLTNMGGWRAVVIDEEGRRSSYKGCEPDATAQAMILRATIEGVSKTEQGCEAKVFSNGEYLVLGINDSRQRRANRELWKELEELLDRHHVQAEYTAKHRWLDEARTLANEAVRG